MNDSFKNAMFDKMLRLTHPYSLLYWHLLLFILHFVIFHSQIPLVIIWYLAVVYFSFKWTCFNENMLLLKPCNPANFYLFKVNNGKTRKSYDNCSKLKIKKPERSHWCRSGVFTVNFEDISLFFSSVEQVHVCWEAQRKFHMKVTTQGQCSIQYTYAVYPSIYILKSPPKHFIFYWMSSKRTEKH